VVVAVGQTLLLALLVGQGAVQPVLWVERRSEAEILLPHHHRKAIMAALAVVVVVALAQAVVVGLVLSEVTQLHQQEGTVARVLHRR
jgi:hypothetical protein